MKSEDYQEVCDVYSRMIQKFLTMVARHLREDYGITVMAVAHLAHICPEIQAVRSSTFAMGEKNIVLRMPEQLQADLEEQFEKISEEEMARDIIRGFQVLEKEKKGKKYIH